MNKTRLKMLFVCIIILTLCVSRIYSQDFKPGEILVAIANLHLRSAPPSGLLNALNPINGELLVGDKVRVLGTDKPQTLFSTYEWIRIEKIEPQSRPADDPDAQSFWVLAVKSGKEPYFERREE